MSSLSLVERETILLFNDGEKTAIVETCNEAWKRKMRVICAKSPECSRVHKDEYCEKYLIPKSWIKVQVPRVFSDEQRRKMRDSARRNFSRGVTV